MAEQTFLIVQADDYGACPAVTDGILAAFAAGVVTQASVMPPAIDAARALWLARRAALPLGVHLTLVSEWETLRWYPVTSAPSLRGADGALLPGVTELREAADPAELLTELRAQVADVRRAGVAPHHLDCHVGVADPAVLARLSAETGLASRDEVPPPGIRMRLDSLWHLSLQPAEHKLAALLAHVTALPPGVHMIVAHPAEDGDELRWLCAPTSRRWKWARDIRLSDSTALLDPAFRETCAANGITLTTWAALDQTAHRRTTEHNAATTGSGATATQDTDSPAGVRSNRTS